MPNESRYNQESPSKGGKVIPIRFKAIEEKEEVKFGIIEELHIDQEEKPIKLHSISHWPITSIDFTSDSKTVEKHVASRFGSKQRIAYNRSHEQIQIRRLVRMFVERFRSLF